MLFRSIYHRPVMFEDFASVVLLAVIEEQPMRRGVVWAAGRIAQARPELVQEIVPRLAAFLDDPDPVVRGYTLRLLDISRVEPDDRHRNLLNDRSRVPIYENGELKEVTVADLAARFSPWAGIGREREHG